MATHPSLGNERGEALSAAVGRRPVPPERDVDVDIASRGSGPGHHVRRVAKGIIRRGIAWYVDPKAEWHGYRAAEEATIALAVQLQAIERRLGDWEEQDPAELTIELELLRAEVRGLRTRVAALEALGDVQQRSSEA